MKSRQDNYGFLGIIGLIVVSLLVLWPLMRHGFFITDDGDWMIIRLSAFYQSLAEGQFPVRFLGRLYHNFGYPVSNFLYPGFLYVGSIIRAVFGFSYVNIVKLLLGLSIAGSGVVLYGTLKKKYDTLSSLGGAASFILSPYVAFDLFTRGSVGELFAFLPASILFYALIARVYWVIPAAAAVLILSHNSLALLFVGVFLILSFTQPKPWIYIRGIALGVGMATFFWLPALFERRYVIFDQVSVADSFSYFLKFPNIFLLGISVIAASVIFFLRRKKDYRLEKWSAIIVLIASFLTLPISRIVWMMIPSLSSLVQFPYRFLSITSLIGALGVAYCMSIVSKRNKIIVCIAIIGILGYLTVYKQMSIVYVDRVEGYYSTNEGTTTVKNEYMPRWVQVIQTARASKKVDVLSGDAAYFSGKETPQRIDGIIDAQSESVVQINTIYYPGWGVAIDGELVLIDYTNPNGLMRIVVPNGRHRLEASFRETGFRLITDVISFAFGILYLIWIFAIRKKS